MSETLKQIHGVADQLRQAGVRSGDRVACLGTSCAGTVTLVLGCWQVGATVVPLSTRYSASMFHEAIAAMQCSVAVLPASRREFALGVRVLPLESVPLPDTDTLGAVRLDQLGLDPAQEASIILTSGSSGRAKGVLHSIGNHVYSARGAEQAIPFAAGDSWLMCLPLYHISGFSLITRALLHGGSIRFMKPEQGLAQSIQRGVTHVSLVPTQLQRLLSDECAPMPKLKAMLVGGAACPPRWVSTAKQRRWPVFLTYGSTEAASQVATASADELEQYPGACGRVLPYRELRIASDGEILLRGSMLFQAYIGAPGPENPFDEAGWFHSGDAGRLDRAGRLYVTGRKDLMFVSGGENIFPEEIERALLAIDGVECCVVVPVPHAEFGQRPLAFIRSSVPQALWSRQIEQALNNLEGFKRPDHVYGWPAHLPISPKPDRLALREYALSLIQG